MFLYTFSYVSDIHVLKEKQAQHLWIISSPCGCSIVFSIQRAGYPSFPVTWPAGGSPCSAKSKGSRLAPDPLGSASKPDEKALRFQQQFMGIDDRWIGIMSLFFRFYQEKQGCMYV
jgi:hypothetical protein